MRSHAQSNPAPVRTGTTLVPHQHQLMLPTCAPDPTRPLLLEAHGLAQGCPAGMRGFGPLLTHTGAGSPGASTANTAGVTAAQGTKCLSLGAWLGQLHGIGLQEFIFTQPCCQRGRVTSVELIKRRPKHWCQLLLVISTKNFSLVAYQKEQENLSALLFLIEHTHTYICVCMAFLKISPLPVFPWEDLGRRGSWSCCRR